eukprot:CAMPEP_0185691014 /NCGR_PEP_ID=MMETSP1164-20130828/1514_1 /TAXON_ID=1104430 /ORGANISM="Chrysoreinhardia sp, Strain CCMP2950" /LENGTH=212 /DNA_ID=CAMNT_0028357637 /DNA_START=16 /DNA_END=654 /DNA_ORIENTATION=-
MPPAAAARGSVAKLKDPAQGIVSTESAPQLSPDTTIAQSSSEEQAKEEEEESDNNDNTRVVARPEVLDRETVDAVLELLSPPCRSEVLAVLDDPDTPELTITCKQDIQTALSGYNQREPYDPVPEIPAETGLLRHQATVSISAVVVVVVVLAVRVLRHRAADAAAHRSASSKGGGASSSPSSNGAAAAGAAAAASSRTTKRKQSSKEKKKTK